MMLTMTDQARTLSVRLAETRLQVALLKADPGATAEDITAAELRIDALMRDFRREICAQVTLADTEES